MASSLMPRTPTVRPGPSCSIGRMGFIRSAGWTSAICEYGGKVNFLLGDTLYLNTGDTMAWSTSTDPLTGLLLNFFTNSSGPNIALTVQPTNVDMSADNVPAAGVSNNGNFYIVCKTGHT